MRPLSEPRRGDGEGLGIFIHSSEEGRGKDTVGSDAVRDYVTEGNGEGGNEDSRHGWVILVQGTKCQSMSAIECNWNFEAELRCGVT